MEEKQIWAYSLKEQRAWERGRELLYFSCLRTVELPGPLHKSQALAEARASQLLLSLLTEDQRAMLHEFEVIDVESRLYPGRRYRIPCNPGAFVCAMESSGRREYLCVQAVEESMPPSDWILMQKLLLEGDELYYLAHANSVVTRE
jgi:hypothetical protein